MVLPLPPRPPKQPQRHTRQALATLRANGDVRGWFGLVKRGRPTKPIELDDSSVVSDLTAPSTDTGVVTAASRTTVGSTVAAMAAAEDIRPLIKCRRKNWASFQAFDSLKAAVLLGRGRPASIYYLLPI